MDGKPLACLDKDFKSISYREANKLDVDLYLQYLTESRGIKKFPEIKKTDVKVDDYVHIFKPNMGFGEQGFGYVKFEHANSLFYVNVAYLFGNSTGMSFLTKRIYVKHASTITLIIRK